MTTRTPARWASRIGVILTVAGSAIGLGSFFRFPAQIAEYGGTFMIPYLVALVVLGLPLMWMEWALGRYGGIWGRHSLPGIYDAATDRPWGKYIGVLGLFIPFVIVVYYTYVESWTLGYSVYAALGDFVDIEKHQDMTRYFTHYVGIGQGKFAIALPAIAFLIITLVLNFYLLYRGANAGLQKLARVAMPLLFLLAAVLVARVLTLPNVAVGLNTLWQPDLTKLADPSMWLAATGQVLFSLSLGLGAVITYSSYLRKDDDVALSGLTTLTINEVAEIILGGTIVIPAAVLFFGASLLPSLMDHGTYSLGFITMPVLFHQMPMERWLGALWFLLLFLAGLSASIAILQPLVAFFQDEIGWSRAKATLVLLLLTAAYLVPVVLFQHYGFLDEMDFWTCNILLALGALVEVVIFVGVIGMQRGWEGITFGAKIHVPTTFKYILMYITPVYLVMVLGIWLWKDAIVRFSLEGIPRAEHPYHIAARVTLWVVLLAALLLLKTAWKRQPILPADQVLHYEEEEVSNVL